MGWSDNAGDLLALQSPGFTGTKSGSLVDNKLELRITAGGGLPFTDADNCTGNISATSNSLSGTFQCKGMRIGSKTIDAQGSFSGTAT